jgi:multiple sugar transport system substrate-binding protein
MRKSLLGMLVVVLLLAACGGPGAEETSSPVPATEISQPAPVPTAAPTVPPVATERTTIRFAISDYEQPLYEDLIRAFEEENPDLHVEVVSVEQVLGLGPIGQREIPDDANQRLAAAADVVDIGVTRQAVQQGLVRDLTPFIEAEPSFQADDFYAGSLAAYQWNGGTWALPTTLNFELIFFDKGAFDQAGVPYPEAGWTWDDLLAKAQALTVRQGDSVTRWGFVPSGSAYRLIESQAGSLADYGTDPPTPRFDDGSVVAATRSYTDLYLKDGAMPYFEPGEQEGTQIVSKEEALIDGGQAAMWSEANILWWIRSQQGNVGVAPYPAGKAGTGLTPVTPGGLAMSAGTRQPNAAWRWLDFASRQALAPLTMGIKLLPARRSVAEAGGYWDGLDEELAAALHYALDHSYVAREAVGDGAFDDALNAILKGDRSVEDALAEAQSQAEAKLLEEVSRQSGATPVPTFVVAPPAAETPISGGVVTIVFAPGLGSLNLEPFRDLAQQFHQAHPDVVVEVKMANFVGGTPSLPSMADAADCFEWYPSFQEAKNREAILSLAPFVDADLSFSTDDYFPQALKQFTWQGQLMGLPADITPYVIEYNKDLFDAAGLDYPPLDWTWDDFLTLAVALTKGEDEQKQYGFVAEFYELNDLFLITERLGARLIDDSVDPPALSYNDPDTVKAMRWYANLTTEHKVKPVYVTDLRKLLAASQAMLDREALINDGRAAMWTSSATAALVFGERSGLNVGVAPLPVRADGTSPGSMLTASGYFISAQTQNRQACWQWITFLSGQPAAVQGLPARRSVAESNAYRQKVGTDRADTYLAAVGDSEQPSVFELFSEEAWLGGASYWYGQAFGQVIDGKASVEDALDTAQQLADDYRACVVAGGDFGQKAWQACAKQTDPTLPDFLFASGQ